MNESERRSRATEAFFGRRKGKPLRERQARNLDDVLPALKIDPGQPAPAELASLFDTRPERIRLEIGFGGGAFSGKDTTKVDRSAAYVSRYLAKNVVAAGLADRCTIQLAYAIGVAQPLSVYVDLHDTGKVSEDEVEAAIRKVIDLSPSGIRRHLDLNKPIYAKTSAYGHFGRKAGRDGSFSWEKLDLVKPLKDALKN